MMQRPSSFTINPSAWPYQGLQCAYLGQHCRDTRVWNSVRRNPVSHGVLTNAASPAPWGVAIGRPCLRLDGTDDYVDMPSNASFTVGANITLATWFRTTNTDAYVAAQDNLLYCSQLIGLARGGNNLYLAVCRSADQSWGFSNTQGSATVNDGAWHHVAVQWQSDAVRWYVDGILDGEDTNFSGGIGDLGVGPIDWGRRDANTSFPGGIADFMFWDRQLSLGQIRRLADRTNVFYDGLIVPWQARLFPGVTLTEEEETGTATSTSTGTATEEETDSARRTYYEKVLMVGRRSSVEEEEEEEEETGTATSTATFTPPPEGKFASPDGDGVGTYADPYDLATALTDGSVDPGETLYLRGGQYSAPRGANNGEFICTLKGTSGNYITIRPYPGERPLIDGTIRDNGSGDYPEYLVFTGNLEFIVQEHVDGDTTTDEAGSWPSHYSTPGVPRGGFFLDYGDNIKIRHCVFRNCYQPLAIWRSVTNCEVYGNIIHTGGWWGPDRRHGHGWYMQNTGTTQRVIQNNMLTDHGAEQTADSTADGQCYGTAADAPIDNFKLWENILFTGSRRSNDEFGGHQLIGNVNNTGMADWDVQYNVGGTLEVGYGGVGCDGVYCSYNLSCDQGLSASGYTQAFTNVHSKIGNYWRNDQLWAAGFWKTETIDGDMTGGYITSIADQMTRIYQSDYDSDRWHVGIMNWALDTSFALDLSSVLDNGDTYELYEPEDYPWGTPYTSGTWDGTPITITFEHTGTDVGTASPSSQQNAARYVVGFVLIKTN